MPDNSKVTATRKRIPGKPFQKGKSGNPGGRPKGDGELRELARTHTVEAVERLVMWMRSENAKASVGACVAILDRGWGKSPQALTDADGGNITIQIVRHSSKAAL